MSFFSSVDSLSALVPVKLNYNSKESLKYSPVVYSNQLAYNAYAVFDNLQDVALSRKNALFLTDMLPISSIFKNALVDSDITKITGTFFLTTSAISLTSTDYLQYSETVLSFDSALNNKAVFTIVPIDSNTVEIYTNDGTPVVADSAYPYTIRPSKIPLGPDEQYRKQFQIDYSNDLISFKTLTKEGYRFVSYGKDRTLKAVGLMFNDKIYNSYLFVPEFVTKSKLNVGFDPTSFEVQYYNDIETFKNRTTLDIKDKAVSETNLLISCATSDITSEEETPTNIALLRTNYTSTGTYAPKH